VVGEGLGVSGSGRAAARPAVKRRREEVNCIVGRSWDGTLRCGRCWKRWVVLYPKRSGER
jgi:hypothetical protein